MRWLLRLALALGAVAGVSVVALALSPYGRVAVIGNDQVCFLRMLNSPPAATEVVVIGSSRIRRGVVPEILALQMARGPDAVVNIAHPSPSLAFDYAVIEALSRERQLDAVIFGLIARSLALHEAERQLDPRGNEQFDLALSSGVFEQLYVVGAPLREQLTLIWRNADSPLLAAWDASKVFADRIRHMIPLLLSGRVYPDLAKQSGDPSPERTTMCWRRAWDNPGDTFQNGNEASRRKRAEYWRVFGPQADGSRWQDPNPLDFLTAPEMAGQRRLVASIVALGEARGFTPVFLYLPGIYVPVAEAPLRAGFRNAFGAELLVPPDELRAELEDGGFYDNSHLNTRGRARFSIWLGDALAELLTRTPAQ